MLALIGESGSGKTTIALALMGYARRGCRIAGGSVRIGDVDVLALGAAAAARAARPHRRLHRAERGRLVQPVAHDHGPGGRAGRASTALLPRAEAEAKAVALFRELALPDPETIGARYPHQVSGGQLQRLMAAMALITDPELVILDEPTTALDVTTQIEVLRAFSRVVRERQATAVYVTHDLAVVAQMADHILVLRDGRMREMGTTEQTPRRAAERLHEEPARRGAADDARPPARRRAGAERAAARDGRSPPATARADPTASRRRRSSRTSTWSSRAARRSA